MSQHHDVNSIESREGRESQRPSTKQELIERAIQLDGPARFRRMAPVNGTPTRIDPIGYLLTLELRVELDQLRSRTEAGSIPNALDNTASALEAATAIFRTLRAYENCVNPAALRTIERNSETARRLYSLLIETTGASVEIRRWAAEEPVRDAVLLVREELDKETARVSARARRMLESSRLRRFVDGVDRFVRHESQWRKPADKSTLDAAGSTLFPLCETARALVKRAISSRAASVWRELSERLQELRASVHVVSPAVNGGLAPMDDAIDNLMRPIQTKISLDRIVLKAHALADRRIGASTRPRAQDFLKFVDTFVDQAQAQSQRALEETWEQGKKRFRAKAIDRALRGER